VEPIEDFENVSEMLLILYEKQEILEYLIEPVPYYHVNYFTYDLRPSHQNYLMENNLWDYSMSDTIICLNDLIPIQKKSTEDFVCVKPATAETLIERGWTLDENLNSITKTSIEDTVENISKYENQQVIITGQFFKGHSWSELERPQTYRLCNEQTHNDQYVVADGYWQLSDEKGNELAVRYPTTSVYGENVTGFAKWSPPDEFLDQSVTIIGKVIPTTHSFDCTTHTSAYLLLETLEDIQNYSE